MGETLRNLSCGCISGIIADVATHPVSTVKTRLQVQGCGGGQHGAVKYSGVTSAFWQILKAEGPVALYRGLGGVIFAAAPAQGMFFGGYEAAKAVLGKGQSSAGNFAAGVFAQLCGSLCWVPMDVVKERLQIEGQIKVTHSYSGSFTAFAHITKAEGILGLYRAFPIHQMTWMPFNACYFMLYEKFKALCINSGYADVNDHLEPIAQVCSGGSAGLIAAAITNPMDVLKTRLQVARANPEMFPFRNSMGAAQHLIANEGFAALMDGTVARMAWLAPRLTICVTAFESVKAMMS